MTPSFMYALFKKLDIEYFAIPVLGNSNGIFEAIEFNTNINSTLFNSEVENIMEGVVIKPLNKVYLDNNNSPFYIKKKNESFIEKSKKPKIKKEYDSNLLKLKYEFELYINDNRLDSAISKLGELTSPNQTGIFMKEVIEDAKIDFLKDFSMDYIKDDFKFITSGRNKKLVNLIKSRL